MKYAKVRTKAEGCHFGQVGEVVARNDRVVGTTDEVFPHGHEFSYAAIQAAELLAAKLGYTVE